MAKAAAKRKQKDEPSSAKRADGSVLRLAWDAYCMGDMVLARRAARRALKEPLSSADQSAARTVSQAIQPLDPAGKPPPELSPQEIAARIIELTAPPSKVYLFAAAMVVVACILIAVALSRQ